MCVSACSCPCAFVFVVGCVLLFVYITSSQMVDGALVQQLGALGGGYEPSSSDGMGPAVSEFQDNGALITDHFTIDTAQDDSFHGSPSSWLPIQTATEQV